MLYVNLEKLHGIIVYPILCRRHEPDMNTKFLETEYFETLEDTVFGGGRNISTSSFGRKDRQQTKWSILKVLRRGRFVLQDGSLLLVAET